MPPILSAHINMGTGLGFHLSISSHDLGLLCLHHDPQRISPSQTLLGFPANMWALLALL